MKIHYATNPMKIGRHEWRCIVSDFYLGGRCTVYQFRVHQNSDHEQWRDYKDWSSYNGDDSYCGLPRSLEKLYNKNYSSIRAHLDNMTLF